MAEKSSLNAQNILSKAKRRLSLRTVFIGVSGLLFVSLLAGGAFLFPKILSLRREIADAEQKVKRLSAQSRALQGFASRESALKTQKAELDKALPEEIDVADYMGRVSQVATRSAVSVGSFNFSPSSAKASDKKGRGKGESVSFLLEISGRYDNILNFIDRLAQFASLSDFKQITISAVAREAGSSETASPSAGGSLQLKGVLSAFYLPKEKESGDLATINLNADDYQQALKIARDLVSWSVGNYPQKTGRANPFSR